MAFQHGLCSFCVESGCSFCTSEPNEVCPKTTSRSITDPYAHLFTPIEKQLKGNSTQVMLPGYFPLLGRYM